MAVSLASVVLALLLTLPVWLRGVNEVSARAIGRVAVICPHCGVPGVVKSNDPRVFR